MKPLSVSSCSCSASSFISDGANLYGARATGVAPAMSDVPGTRSRVHTHDHGGSEAHDELSNSIQLSEPKPLRKHRPPPLQSILSSVESS
ncbi:hypothetical protein Tco_1578308 [Tanacetum coccineum]